MPRRNVLPLALGLAACAAVLPGCGKPREPVPFNGGSSSSSSNTAPAKPTPAPVAPAQSAPAKPAPAAEDAKPAGDASFSGYMRNLSNAPKVAAKTIDTAQLNRAVQQFQAMEGRFPKSLDELVTANYLPAIPAAPRGSNLNYNPATGEVTVVPAP